MRYFQVIPFSINLILNEPEAKPWKPSPGCRSRGRLQLAGEIGSELILRRCRRSPEERVGGGRGGGGGGHGVPCTRAVSANAAVHSCTLSLLCGVPGRRRCQASANTPPSREEEARKGGEVGEEVAGVSPGGAGVLPEPDSSPLPPPDSSLLTFG